MIKPKISETTTSQFSLKESKLPKIIADIFCFEKSQSLTTVNVAGENDLIKNKALKYLIAIQRNIAREGKKETVSLYMKLYKIATCLSLQKPFEPLQFKKSFGDGVPVLLQDLLPELTSDDPKKKSLALTIAGLIKIYKTDPVFDREPIEGPGVDLDAIDFQNFRKSCKLFARKYKMSPIKNESLRFHAGMATGPNGQPALRYCFEDSKSYRPGFLQSLYNFAENYANAEVLSEIFEYADGIPFDEKSKLSRIALIPEGGGKTRTIAICDYWSQVVLKPLHDKVMRLLKKIPMDGTYVQNEQFDRVKELTSSANYIHCYDLTAATDRFPIKVQAILLDEYFGSDFSQQWVNLMTDRDFHTPDGNKIRWSVGQPLGMYSSWPIFALTHHAFLFHCARTQRENPFKFEAYALLGDDVVIWSNTSAAVGQAYYDKMIKIGVKINLSKSVIGTKDTHRVEFAKRLLFQRHEISPVPAKMLMAYVEDSTFIVQLLTDLRRRGLYSTGRLIPGEALIPKRDRHPTRLVVDFFIYPDTPLLRANIWGRYPYRTISEMILKIRVEIIRKRIARMQTLIRKCDNSESMSQMYEKFCTPESSRGRRHRQPSPFTGDQETFFAVHPLISIISRRMEDILTLETIIYKVSILGEEGYKELYGETNEEIRLLEFTPDPLLDKWFISRQHNADKEKAKMLREALKRLKRNKSLILKTNDQINESVTTVVD